MRVLLTGASSFSGYWLAAKLRSRRFRSRGTVARDPFDL